MAQTHLILHGWTLVSEENRHKTTISLVPTSSNLYYTKEHAADAAKMIFSSYNGNVKEVKYFSKRCSAPDPVALLNRMFVVMLHQIVEEIISLFCPGCQKDLPKSHVQHHGEKQGCVWWHTNKVLSPIRWCWKTARSIASDTIILQMCYYCTGIMGMPLSYLTDHLPLTELSNELVLIENVEEAGQDIASPEYFLMKQTLKDMLLFVEVKEFLKGKLFKKQ